MIFLILISIFIIIISVCIPSKEKFYGQPLYPGIHKYYADSYKYGLNGNKKKSYTNYFKYAIPLVNHIIL